MNPGRCQRWRMRRDTYRPAGEPIPTREYEVAELLSDKTAREFVEGHHYSASYPAARFRFGLYHHGQLAGVAVFSHPCRDEVLACLPGEPGARVELGRFVLLDEVPANGETWMLARCFEQLRAVHGIAGVVSFSDPYPRTSLDGRRTFPGHIGTIYQAFNGTYVGQARADRLRLLPDGSSLHNRAVAKVRAQHRGWWPVVERLQAFGAGEWTGDADAWLARWLPLVTRTVRHPGNHKYAWVLDHGLWRHSASPAGRWACPRRIYPKRTAA